MTPHRYGRAPLEFDFAIPTQHNRRRLGASRHVMLLAGVILGAAVLFNVITHVFGSSVVAIHTEATAVESAEWFGGEK